MGEYKLGEMEERFANMIWEKEPMGSGDLVRLCNETFGWKKSTTYTMLKRLCLRGYFTNKDSVITALITKAQLKHYQGQAFLNDGYEGSLPKFLASFANQEKLSPSAIEEIQALINQYKEDNT